MDDDDRRALAFRFEPRQSAADLRARRVVRHRVDGEPRIVGRNDRGARIIVLQQRQQRQRRRAGAGDLASRSRNSRRLMPPCVKRSYRSMMRWSMELLPTKSFGKIAHAWRRKFPPIALATKKGAAEAAPLIVCLVRRAYIMPPMPPMPPPGGIAGAGSFGSSATIASVVTRGRRPSRHPAARCAPPWPDR